MRRRELLKAGLGLPICGIVKANTMRQKAPMRGPDWSKVDVTGDFYTFARSLQSVISHVATCALKFYPSKVSDYFPEWQRRTEAGFDITINGEFFLWFGIYESDYQELSPEERLNLVRETWDGQVMTYREMAEHATTVLQHLDPDYDPRSNQTD